MSGFRFQAKRIFERAVYPCDPDVRLVGQTYQMSENADLSPVGLHLAEYEIRSVQRGCDGSQISLLARESEDLRVADNAIPVVALRGQRL